MPRMIKLLFIALCLLLLGQGEAQDVQPELPEDFPSLTSELITTSSDVPVTEPIPTTEGTTTRATTMEPSSTEPPSTELPITEPPATTQSTPMTESTTVASPYPPYWPTRPDYSSTTSSTNEVEDKWNEPKRCYLKENYDYDHWSYRYAFSGYRRPLISCYNCCYYGLNTFADCSKVFDGECGMYGHLFGYGK